MIKGGVSTKFVMPGCRRCGPGRGRSCRNTGGRTRRGTGETRRTGQKSRHRHRKKNGTSSMVPFFYAARPFGPSPALTGNIRSMDTFIQQLINGLTLGFVYAVVALGYTMVYGIIQLINFAHGEVVMIGAMVAFSVITALAGSGLPPLFDRAAGHPRRGSGLHGGWLHDGAHCLPSAAHGRRAWPP